jgi:hypothetical protein
MTLSPSTYPRPPQEPFHSLSNDDLDMEMTILDGLPTHSTPPISPFEQLRHTMGGGPSSPNHGHSIPSKDEFEASATITYRPLVHGTGIATSQILHRRRNALVTMAPLTPPSSAELNENHQPCGRGNIGATEQDACGSLPQPWYNSSHQGCNYGERQGYRSGMNYTIISEPTGPIFTQPQPHCSLPHSVDTSSRCLNICHNQPYNGLQFQPVTWRIPNDTQGRRGTVSDQCIGTPPDITSDLECPYHFELPRQFPAYPTPSPSYPTYVCDSCPSSPALAYPPLGQHLKGSANYPDSLNMETSPSFLHDLSIPRDEEMDLPSPGQLSDVGTNEGILGFCGNEAFNSMGNTIPSSATTRTLRRYGGVGVRAGVICVGTGSGSNRNKDEEPYAQLIYRAFMSTPRRALTLQQIYAWFRENTDKDKHKDGGKGWQNSIRHNLSMNGVSRPGKRIFWARLNANML